MSSLFQKTIIPLFLIVCCPPTAILAWYICANLNGSLLNFYHIVLQDGFLNTLWQIWKPVFFGTAIAWKLIFIFMVSQLVLMKIIPGKKITGPETPEGNIPIYKNNGFFCFLVTVFLYCTASFWLHLFSPSIIYNHFAGILGALNIFSLLFCLFLYFKGLFFPSSSDHSASGNFIFDYYWGTELYPRILGWDVKQFTNCRFGMMSWSIIIISFAAKQAELFGLSNAMIISIGIMLVYIAKFFYWESGYLRSMDIMHDRAGFYICWGCLVWVPSIYTLPAMYLVNHPYHFSNIIAIIIFAFGVLSVLLNYLADRQRQLVRKTGGNCKIWGKKPELIFAEYQNEKGEIKKSILLASGFWGISRHFHYLLEILLAFFWTLPVLFLNFLPWFYVIFLTILLVHRSYRDEARCRNKYREYWDQYCKQIPNKIIPWSKIF